MDSCLPINQPETEESKNKYMDNQVTCELNYICQPCDERGNNKPATHWCMTCPDFICEGCHAMHMTLRSTRNHIILEMDDYMAVGKFLTQFDNRCKSHPGEVLNYFCFTHTTPCCCVCKDKNHTKNCHIHHEDEISVREDNCQVLLKNTDLVEKGLRDIARKIEENENAALNLNSEREQFEAEIIAGRKKVNEFYDEFEAEARQKFNKYFRKKQKSIRFQQEQACEQHKSFTTLKETMEKIKNLSTTKLQTFLIGKVIQKDLNEISQFPHLTTDFKLNLVPRVKLYPDKQTIALTYESPSHPDHRTSTPENTEENSSSTMEDEKNIAPSTNHNSMKTKSTESSASRFTPDSYEAVSNTSEPSIIQKHASPDTNRTSSTTIETVAKNKIGCVVNETISTTKIMTSADKLEAASIIKREASETKDIVSNKIETASETKKNGSGKIKPDSDTNSKGSARSKSACFTKMTTSGTNETGSGTKKSLELHKDCDINKGVHSYHLKSSFNVEHRYKNFEIVSLGFMDPDIIVMSEISEKSLLFYHSNGSKDKEERFTEKPGDIAIIEDHKIVVIGVFKVLFFIDYTTLRRRFIYLKDIIEGVSVANGFAFVCLQQTGIVKIDRLGNTIRRFPAIKGCLSICVTTDCLYSVDMSSNTNELHCYNLSTHIKKTYTSKSNICGNKGIQCDIHGNVYLSDENSKVYMFDKETKCFSAILSGDSGIPYITSISCSSDAKTLVVACNGGPEIKVFEKQNIK